MSIRVLIIEDENLIRWSLRQKFEQRSFTVSEAEDGKTGLKALDTEAYDLVMLDYRLPDITGLDVLRKLREHDPDVVVIMMTAYSSIESAVEAIKLGAYDYVTKPFQMDELMLTVDKALETTKLRREVRELRRRLGDQFGFDRIIGQHPSMAKLFEMVSDIARSGTSTVFLRGETGTGKDLLAGAIHHHSDRAARSFMNITCTAISETLLESELFGHEKGAFTDARSRKKGLFELADGGTVFLDEVGDMPPVLQAKLLHFLESRRFRRVGGVEEIAVDVRVIAATNRDIEAAIEKGDFREDLMFRLNVVPVFIPPLRERGDDLTLLTQHFVQHYAREFKKPMTKIANEVYEKARNYHWPGNVRELRNVIERAVLLCKTDGITAADIALGRPETGNAAHNTREIQLPPDGLDLASLEKQLLQQALQRTDGNQTKAARLLHLSRDTFRYRLEKHNLL
jgi:DNA-binding NtrC family response regulator